MFNWLKDEGIKILSSILIGIIFYIILSFIIKFIIKGFVRSSIKSLEISRKSLNRANIIIDNNEIIITEDEKLQIQHRSDTVGSVLKSIVAFFIFSIIMIQVLDILNMPTESLLTGTALLGLVIAFSIQKILRDFINGIFILIEGSYNIGDWVTINNNISGEISKLTLRITTLKNIDGSLYIIPNGTVDIIQNHSRDFNLLILSIGITYESNLDKCMELLNNEIKEEIKNDKRIIDLILEDPYIDGINELSDYSVNIRYCMKCKPGMHFYVKRIVNFYIHKYLSSDIAYPTTKLV